jgi:predicted transcriptional regulator
MGRDAGTIASQLRVGRETAGLSQRAVSAMSGVQQGQLSKIENGAVDPRLSSIEQIARSLGLELVLVPRRSLTAVQAVLDAGLEVARPAYVLDDDD